MWKTTKDTVIGKKVKNEADAEQLIVAPEHIDSVPYRVEVIASGVEGVEVGDVVLYMPSGRTYSAYEFLPSVGEEPLVNVHELCILAVIPK